MIIEISENRKHKIVEYPDYFKKYENGHFTRCVSKAQFDYFISDDIHGSYMFFDYKKKIIYFHEWDEPILTDDCDYAWGAACNYKKKVFNIWAN